MFSSQLVRFILLVLLNSCELILCLKFNNISTQSEWWMVSVANDASLIECEAIKIRFIGIMNITEQINM
jgi:hypothetical protein